MQNGTIIASQQIWSGLLPRLHANEPDGSEELERIFHLPSQSMHEIAYITSSVYVGNKY